VRCSRTARIVDGCLCWLSNALGWVGGWLPPTRLVGVESKTANETVTLSAEVGPINHESKATHSENLTFSNQHRILHVALRCKTNTRTGLT